MKILGIFLILNASIIGNIIEKFENIKTFKVYFEWLSARKFLFKGFLYYDKNKGIKVEFKKPPEKILIANKKYFIMINQTEKLIGIEKLKNENPLFFMYFLKKYKIEKTEPTKDGYRVYLSNDTENWRRLIVETKGENTIDRLIIYSINGKMKIRFSDWETGIKFPKDFFKITKLPSKYQIIYSPFEEDKEAKK